MITFDPLTLMIVMFIQKLVLIFAIATVITEHRD